WSRTSWTNCVSSTSASRAAIPGDHAHPSASRRHTSPQSNYGLAGTKPRCETRGGQTSRSARPPTGEGTRSITGISRMQLAHTLAATSVRFDEPILGSDVGLAPTRQHLQPGTHRGNAGQTGSYHAPTAPIRPAPSAEYSTQ